MIKKIMERLINSIEKLNNNIAKVLNIKEETNESYSESNAPQYFDQMIEYIKIRNLNKNKYKPMAEICNKMSNNDIPSRIVYGNTYNGGPCIIQRNITETQKINTVVCEAPIDYIMDASVNNFNFENDETIASLTNLLNGLFKDSKAVFKPNSAGTFTANIEESSDPLWLFYNKIHKTNLKVGSTGVIILSKEFLVKVKCIENDILPYINKYKFYFYDAEFAEVFASYVECKKTCTWSVSSVNLFTRFIKSFA